MTISPEILSRIYALGLSKKQLCEIMMIISELPMQSVTAGALRMKRYRGVTQSVTECVTQPPLKVSPEVSPKSNIKPLPTPFLNPPIEIAKAISCPNQKFDDFWGAYPRREAKQAARKKFETIVKAGTDAGKIITAAGKYAAVCRAEKREKQFIKSPDTWLNKGCWDDEIPTQARSNSLHVGDAPKWEHRSDGWWRDGAPVNKDGTSKVRS